MPLLTRSESSRPDAAEILALLAQCGNAKETIIAIQEGLEHLLQQCLQATATDEPHSQDVAWQFQQLISLLSGGEVLLRRVQLVYLTANSPSEVETAKANSRRDAKANICGSGASNRRVELSTDSQRGAGNMSPPMRSGTIDTNLGASTKRSWSRRCEGNATPHRLYCSNPR